MSRKGNQLLLNNGMARYSFFYRTLKGIKYTIKIVCMPLYAFFKMSHIKIKRKDIHKISVIFRLFSNILQTNLKSVKSYM